MSIYLDYLAEIESRKTQGLAPKPIDDGALVGEIIAIIQDAGSEHRADALKFFIYNTLPGTTSAAGVKAAFLKKIILGDVAVAEITPAFALELLSHMKGGPSIEVLLDLTLGDDAAIASQAGDVLKTQVFLYDADMFRLRDAFAAGNAVAKDVLESYAKAEFFTKLPEVEDEIKVVTFIAGEGDISTDLLSPGNQAHSRSDRELHGLCMITPEAQQQIVALKEQHPDKRVMLIAEKGTMGVGSSRMSGVNNVALWAGKQSSPYVPFVNYAPVVAGTNGISPIFATTVDVTGGIGLNLKNWVKMTGPDGKAILNNDGNPVLEEAFSVATGTVLKIDVKNRKLTDEAGNELVDVAAAFTPQKMEFMKAGSSYAIVFGKKLQTFAAETLGVEAPAVFAPNKEITVEGQGLTAVEKIFNRNAVGVAPGKVLHAGSDVRVTVNIVGSQDTTGLMTAQELEAMAATVISPLVDGAYQSGCHTASVWDKKAQANIPKLMSFMNNFGLITARDPKGVYHAMTDVIHKVLNDITVDDWAIIIGGDSHTRMSKGVAFGADSGTVALALATGEATMPIPQSVKVTFKGKMQPYMDFRDVVHATQAQMLAQFGGENVFQGRIIEVHIGTLLADQAFTFTDWTAEMKAKASICISENETLIESLEIAKSRIQIMIDKGMENAAGTLKGLIALADKRIAEIRSGEKPALTPDDNAKYFAEVVVDLDLIDEPMIADPDVNNADVSKRYTHDTIRPVSYYGGTKKVDLGFIGSCMVHKGDMKILAQMLKNIEAKEGKVEFKAPLVVAPPTYNIVDELKAEGDWDVLKKYAGFEFDDLHPKNAARTEYENMLYLERPGCNLCMGNQEKAAKGDTVLATSTRLFQGRVVEDTANKKGESLLASTPLVVLSTILGRTPNMDEYRSAVTGIDLTKFAPPAAH
ncbi:MULTISPECIES: bifunctional aconitate hydratase 2/2-methylisocitrate dehydratase [Sphingobium]|jgi:aconitate hydratase 2/2-methylisocitrate dehydratase|uniref:bifunctional aconitate hydratase 2/2-methylisocitrate dehydratase n=1 Tax=Sphingobium TaxID=165695 RepID=UPI000DBB6256|nr:MULTISPECIES: bifunctional aconitate hydratase 2/2-methylisocitrate dehydratase [Sphingobium]KAA9012428.1 bifunctional aconitate hydratase 2/2-methylisocitrate dehydratase [Sphingobium limneticum]MBU0932271.1 bifunctional aconitate hydratase 2/2-methylisocitrate dehydratase [Alphaproteobacteria bacterium]BBD00232.1 aconitate hydratase 2/2-methylisocitrate dehydratase [Sphingobium sp. YG1]